MENRFTDVQLVASLDAGHQSLPWDPGQPSGLLAPLDLGAIVESPHAAEIVPSLPVQALYYALKQRGFEDSLEILPLLSQEQVERMVDYEAWHKDDLQPRKLLDFINIFGEVSQELLFQRFSELDEEYQLSTLQGRFQIYEAESILDLPEELQDRVSAMPCGTVFYEIIGDDAEENVLIEKILEASKEYNLRYAYSLIGHAAFMPPSEQELLLRQFRRARLEEDGFVSYQDSQELFMPFDAQTLLEKWRPAESVDSAMNLQSATPSEYSFIDRVFALAQKSAVDVDELFQIHHGFLYLANAMCAVTQIEPDDVKGVHRLMEQGKALVNLGLEALAGGDEEVGLTILRQEAAAKLFRYGLYVIDQLRANVLEKLRLLGMPGLELIEKSYRLRQWGRILLEVDRHWLERIGLESAETFKGLWNRFPMRPMRCGDDGQKIHFKPIISLADFQEFCYSLSSMLGYFAAVIRTGQPLNQPFEAILRESAIQSLAEGARGVYVDADAEVPQLLSAWRDGLRKDRERWFLNHGLDIESVLDEVVSLVHSTLHGLIILPRSKPVRSVHSEEERV